MKNTETLVDFVQSMVVVRHTFHIFGDDILEITKKVYGKEIRVFTEFHSETYQYKVKNIINEYTEETVQAGMLYGSVTHNKYGDILNDLCHKGLLEEGDYCLDCRKR